MNVNFLSELEKDPRTHKYSVFIKTTCVADNNLNVESIAAVKHLFPNYLSVLNENYLHNAD